MLTHALYIDDSGTKEYASDPSQHGVTGNSRYFVFGGVLVSLQEGSRLSSVIAELKRSRFGTADVEIKSNWLRIAHERESRYLAPYGISSQQLDEFVAKYYELVLQSELVFVAGVVDKQHTQETYPEKTWYAPAIAYEIVLQRVQKVV